VRLLALRAQHFRSFGALDVDLNVDGLIAVVGPNGAGKTTLFDAVEWGLYGGARGRSALPARRDGAPEDEDTWVAVEFEAGGRAYRVVRVDGRDATLTDLGAEEEPIVHGREPVSRQVAILLGLTRDMFRATFYARQREVQALEADNDRRRAQVELLLGIERLRRAAAHAGTAAREQRLLVESLESEAPDVPALKEEADRIERAAQEAAPVVQAAEAALAAARARRDAARDALDALRAAEAEGAARRGRAEAAAAEAARQAAAFETLAAQAAEAEAAIAQLAALEPVAARAGELAAAEQQLDARRAESERAQALRDAQEEALRRAAKLADRAAALGEDPAAALVAARERGDAIDAELDGLDGTLQEVARTRAAAERRVAALRAAIERGARAATIDDELAALDGAEAEAETADQALHALRARRDQLAEAIRHDTEHRDAVLAGDREARCPTCRRPFADDERMAVLARYEADLAAAEKRLMELDAELMTGRALAGETRRRAQRVRHLEADRRALGDDVPGAEELTAQRQERAALDEQLTALVFHEGRARDRRAELQSERGARRAEVTRLQEAAAQQAAYAAERAAAEREAERLAAQRAELGVDDFDPGALAAVRRELAEAHEARHRAAALRGQADGAELLRRRRDEQQKLRAAAEVEANRLRAAAEAAGVAPEAIGGAESERAEADAAVDAATTALIEANRVASAESEAVATARRRLQDGKRLTARLRDQRRELRVRQEVADALAAYREEASRAARPTLEHETALLLAQTTRGRYGGVALTADYQLELLDEGRLFPLRRFSGGEQDLAGLCLRLALSRTLARQRGAETGFILLDEVFGSQDLDRRRTLLEQLHAIADSEFRQVFVISHTDDVVQHCDLTIDVSREAEGVSVVSGPHA
jgi:DNA repair protein SbcC/Rad50